MTSAKMSSVLAEVDAEGDPDLTAVKTPVAEKPVALVMTTV
jgi:hypothetical protein